MMKKLFAACTLSLLLSAPVEAVYPADLEELRAIVLNQINNFRAEQRFPLLLPYTLSARLNDLAQDHADDLAAHFDERTHTYLAHTSSDGRTFLDRLRTARIPLTFGNNVAAENTAFAYRNPFVDRFPTTRGRHEDLPTRIRESLLDLQRDMMEEVAPEDDHRRAILGPYTHVGIGMSLLNIEGADENAVFLVTDFALLSSALDLPRGVQRARQILRRETPSSRARLRKLRRGLRTP